MEFSKDNIASKRFSKKIFGGLDEFEVRDFLHVLAEEIKLLAEQSARQKSLLEEKESLIKDYRDREHILKKSISSAEKWAEKIRQNAAENSSLILEKAHAQSEALIQEARQSLQSVYNDIANLKRLRLQFKTGLKAALQVQMDLLEQDPLFGPNSSVPAENMKSLSEKEDSPSSLDSPKSPAQPHSPASKERWTEPKINDKELSSLKESLSSLNKNFS